MFTLMFAESIATGNGIPVGKRWSQNEVDTRRREYFECVSNKIYVPSTLFPLKFGTGHVDSIV